jgi:16S rRNA G1207 methylase RsmC
MDWTDFDADNQATIMLALVSRHGRSTPLMWLTVDKATLKNHRNAYEYRVLVQLAEALPVNVKVLIVADRGFGDQKLYQTIENIRSCLSKKSRYKKDRFHLAGKNPGYESGNFSAIFLR